MDFFEDSMVLKKGIRKRKKYSGVHLRTKRGEETREKSESARSQFFKKKKKTKKKTAKKTLHEVVFFLKPPLPSTQRSSVKTIFFFI